MKARINEIYRRPLPEDFWRHMRDDLGLTEEYRAIMDSMRQHSADSQFHYDNTMIPEARFERMLHRLNDTELTELIRLAIIGFRTETHGKLN